ncbi:DNA alkylation repair protein [Tessaracoccus sp. OH4464_COT-324]|uniref:DNA alkylation repair protein n=1 Tax=Tessaracoccus sp. OH4464_COT-324 TaxID=2491059 RepID=UPI000F63EBEC|nr:DNA alkylation repair protein [Tessaracoccus sp. OH4464_COT-324]RRD46097.1 DNA alkylation repair protein [Tessaracoccus sp. OH4464_COT-324]
MSEIRRLLAAAGDPERAASQQAYMKSAMPFRGVGVPQVRKITRGVVRKMRFTSLEELSTFTLNLWDNARYREERYAALAVLRAPAARPFLDASALPLVRHLVVTGAWWDLVDETAHVLETILTADAQRTVPVIEAWAEGEDMWLRRVAILSQLQRGADTDVNLLGRVIAKNLLGSLHGDQFFIRKAIGWALRQYARCDADWVRAFLTEHERKLSALSRREAAKYL